MRISAKGRYSMQALFDLAHHSHGQPVPLHLIAERQHLSLPCGQIEEGEMLRRFMNTATEIRPKGRAPGGRS